MLYNVPHPERSAQSARSRRTHRLVRSPRSRFADRARVRHRHRRGARGRQCDRGRDGGGGARAADAAAGHPRRHAHRHGAAHRARHGRDAAPRHPRPDARGRDSAAVRRVETLSRAAPRPPCARTAPRAGRNFAGALFHVLAADVSMSLDNVLAIAGAARDHFVVLVIGLLLSVGLMGIASNVLAPLMARHRWISWVGLAIVTFVALRMIYDGSAEVIAPLALSRGAARTGVAELRVVELGEDAAAPQQLGEARRCSAIRPSRSTRIRSALRTVERRWAMMKVVRPARQAVDARPSPAPRSRHRAPRSARRGSGSARRAGWRGRW